MARNVREPSRFWHHKSQKYHNTSITPPSSTSGACGGSQTAVGDENVLHRRHRVVASSRNRERGFLDHITLRVYRRTHPDCHDTAGSSCEQVGCQLMIVGSQLVHTGRMKVKEDPPSPGDEHSPTKVKEDPPSSEDENSPTKEPTTRHEPQHSGSKFYSQESKIVAPSHWRVMNGKTITRPSGKMSPPTKNTDIYKRSMLHRAAREQKLQQTKEELMVACTFTPETNKSGSSHDKRSTVLDPLHSESKKITPRKADGQQSGSLQKRSPTSVSSCGSKPRRIDQLYQDGLRLRRERNRDLTNKQEDEQRRRRWDEKEMEKCTFRPNMDWRKKKPLGVHGKTSPNGSKNTTTNHSLCTPKSHDFPPVNVIITQALSTPNVRQGPHSFVSPLRGPETESVGEDTEYGSI